MHLLSPEPSPPARRLLRSAFLSWLVVLLAGAPLRAQLTDLSASRRREGAPGVALGTHTEAGPNPAEFDYLELDLGAADGHLGVVLPPDGPLGSGEMAFAARQAQARAAIGILPAPSINSPDPLLPGLVLDGRRLFAWPPGEGAHLLVAPEGRLSLETLDQGVAALTFEDGAQIPLVGINRALPQQAGEAALMTGRLSALELPAASWPADLITVVLEAQDSPADIHAHLLEDPYRTRTLRTQPPLDRRGFRSEPGQGVLLLKPPVPADVLERFQRRMPVTITVTLPSAAQLAQVVVPVPEPAAVPDQGTEATAGGLALRNALALEPRGGRLMALSTGDRAGRRRFTSLADAAPFLRREGYGAIIPLPDSAALLLINPEAPPEVNPAAQTPVRLALGLLPGRPSLALPGVMGNLRRLRPGAVAGTGREPPGNPAGALADGEAAFDAGLGNFWMAPWEPPATRPPDDPAQEANAVQFFFPRAERLAAVEVLHASMAGFSPGFNAHGWRLWGRPSARDRWELLAEYRAEIPAPRDRVLLEQRPLVQQVVLEVTDPAHLPGAETMRLAEVLFWAQAEE